MKLTILPKSYGYTGDALSRMLEEKQIYSEFADPDHLVLMLPVEFDAGLPERLLKAFLAIPRREKMNAPAPVLQRAKAVLDRKSVV